jgi:hypothetical protein
MSAVLPSQGGEVKVTAVDDIGNQNTEAIVVDVSPSNPIGDCEEGEVWNE